MESTIYPVRPVMIYHVVLVDIVKYSERKKPQTQRCVVELLSSILKDVVKTLDLESRVKYLPTGDGAAICIEQRSDKPAEALDFVLKLALTVQQWNDDELNKAQPSVRQNFLSKWWSDETKAFALRIGVSVGPLFHYVDLNGYVNLAGAAINQAARLLTIPGPTQVVFSETATELVRHAERHDVEFLKIEPSTIKGRSYSGFQLIGPPGINRMPIEPKSQESEQTDGWDYLPHMWIRSNHSRSEIVWMPEVKTDKWAQVVNTVIKHYGEFISTPTEIERPAHVEASEVYRIAARDVDKRQIFLRVFKRRKSDAELRQLCNIHKKIVKAGIFGEYGECLLPLRTSADGEWVKPQRECDQQAMAFYFLNQAWTGGPATHFKGESEQEIESVAERFGQVNSVLIGSSLTPIHPLHFPWDPDGWNFLIKEVQKSNAIPLRTMYLARSELKLIRDTRSMVVSLRRESRYPIVLNDFHPHNVFVSEGKCVLIVDYDAVRNDWPEEAACAFALHRFCREYVRRLVRVEHRETGVERVVQTAAEAFLRGYGRARPDIINAVKTTGLQWAKAVNFAKLMGVIRYGAKLDRDPAKRTEEQHFREVVKFISYLKELDVFESALS